MGSLLLFLLVLSDVFGQQVASIQSQKPIILLQNDQQKSLRQVLQELQERYQVYINYKSEVIDSKLVAMDDVALEKDNVEEVFQTLLAPLGLTYEKLKENYYVIYNKQNSQLKPVPKKINTSSAASGSQESQLSVLPEKISKQELRALLNLEQTVQGKVIDLENGEPLPGVNILAKGTTQGTVTDVDGNYRLTVGDEVTILVFSSIGFLSEEVEINGRTTIDIGLAADIQSLQEIVVVGYGEQKKESVVGAIANVDSEVLTRRGGVTNLSSALSGQVPGVNVLEVTGEPGVNDPAILIRGQSTWNGAYPLILVDGVERRMNDIDVSEVESVSVLKDASATAVFGVKGANGVILITTKRGQEGKASLNVGANMGIKTISKIFSVMDAYEGIAWKNEAIEHEVVVQEAGWGSYLPYDELQYYKRPQQSPYQYIYPNVDWQDEITKDFATTYRVNMNVSGGTKSAKYFGSLAYINEGDILESDYNELKDYDPGYAYNRLNFRGNLDFDLTNTTKLAVNLSGYTGVKKETNTFSTRWIYGAMYNLAPDIFPVRHEDGTYGMNPNGLSVLNPNAILNETGVKKTNRSQITSDIKLTQSLDFITEGLSAGANLSYDVYFTSSGPNILDGGNNGQVLYKYIDPSILNAETAEDSLNAIQYFTSGTSTAINEFDFVYQPSVIVPGQVQNNLLSRALFYQLSLNYARTFEKHDVSGLLLLNRRENAIGPEFKHYREDWVGRVTYNYGGKYFLEVNGAYNGSEKFGPGYRFGFFPSAAAGWMISEEGFLNYDWLDKVKIRGSIGKVGSDAGIPRWGYIGSWIYGGSNMEGYFGRPDGSDVRSPYVVYSEGVIPNPNLSWETAIKRNIGVELGFFQNAIFLNVDVFKDNREDIFLSGERRNIPATFGAPPVPINYGQTETQGFEIELGLRKLMSNGLMGWANFSMTRAVDKIILNEDPSLLPDYLKLAGYQIGQTTSQIRNGFINNWDEAYAGAGGDNNQYKMPGDWNIVDYNADGVINSFDVVPFGYPDRPQNTYSAMAGLEYKNFSVMVQFYGVTNINQKVNFGGPRINETIVSEYYRDYWTPANTDAYYKAPRLLTGSSDGDFSVFDGSYLRLKTAEIAYNLPKSFLGNLGLSDARIYVNGNNLFFWSDLPQDQETGDFDIFNSYPMFRQYNFGINVNF